MKINDSGQILLEVLIAMAVAAVVVLLGSQLIYISLVGDKNSEDGDVASGLVYEDFSATAAAATENWSNITSLTAGSTHYYAQQSAGKWLLVAGTETVPLNLVSYSRYFTVQNVCRDMTTRAITGISDSGGSAGTCTGISGSSIDPSTEKINVTVSWAGSRSASGSIYLTRWRNSACPNLNWIGGKTYPTDSLYLCSGATTNYYNDDGNVDVSTANALKLLSY
jgi:hypothetical protein